MLPEKAWARTITPRPPSKKKLSFNHTSNSFAGRFFKRQPTFADSTQFAYSNKQLTVTNKNSRLTVSGMSQNKSKKSS